jgi:AraC-like DNA-binding protein
MRDGSTAAWMQSSIRFSVAQSASGRPGSAMILARLSEVLFAEAIRQHMDTLTPEETGWLAALRDRYVGRTLAILHDRPAQPWTVDELASKVGLSRSALGQRFVALIGKPPMDISCAGASFSRQNTCARAVRPSSGSRLTSATNRKLRSTGAFKRELGVPPAAWRRRAVRA